MSHAPRFHRLAVNDLRRETADAVSLTFAIPKELEDDYRFSPGQYLTLRTMMDGEEVRRSYSICSGPDDGELRIAVKKVDGGAFSSWAADELKCGDELDVMTPTGRFGVAPQPAEARVYVGFAAGSGITPILSIVKGVLAREPDSRFFLFYGNRSTGGMLFREALEELKDRFIAAALGVSRHLGRGAGHPDPAWPARWREGEGAVALAGAGGQRRPCLHLRSHRHERGHRGDLPGYRHRRGAHSCRALCLRIRRQAAPESRRTGERAAEGDGRADHRRQAPRGAGRRRRSHSRCRVARRAWICRSPARAACARPAAPSSSRALRRWK